MSPFALSVRFLQTQPDARLLALARAGHEPAFEALVHRYRRSLLTYCNRLTAAGGSPEDTLQQALLQAWTALSGGIEVRDARAWLFRIAHNVAVSDLRRSRASVVELSFVADPRGADHEAEQRIAVREALAGIAALPGLQREVMVASAVDGLSHEQLASELGLSRGAVRGLIYRARAALRSAAAAVIPVPVLSWMTADGGAGVPEVVAGGGSAGAIAVLLKSGSMVVAAGALATASGITSLQSLHHAVRTGSDAWPSEYAGMGAVRSAAGGSTRAAGMLVEATLGRGSHVLLRLSDAPQPGGGSGGGVWQRPVLSPAGSSQPSGPAGGGPHGGSPREGALSGERYGGGRSRGGSPRGASRGARTGSGDSPTGYGGGGGGSGTVGGSTSTGRGSDSTGRGSGSTDGGSGSTGGGSGSTDGGSGSTDGGSGTTGSGWNGFAGGSPMDAGAGSPDSGGGGTQASAPTTSTGYAYAQDAPNGDSQTGAGDGPRHRAGRDTWPVPNPGAPGDSDSTLSGSSTAHNDASTKWSSSPRGSSATPSRWAMVPSGSSTTFGAGRGAGGGRD